MSVGNYKGDGGWEQTNRLEFLIIIIIIIIMIKMTTI